MEPTHYLRVIRLRWKLVAVLLILGGMVGYASSLRSADDEAPVATYWVAKHVLVVSLDATAGRFPNLPQLALRITGGDVPEQVAAELGGDPKELAARVRTVTLPDVSAIEISAVADDPDQVSQLADAFAGSVLEFLRAEDTAAYEADLDRAAREVDARKQSLDEVEREIAELNRQLGEITGETGVGDGEVAPAGDVTQSATQDLQRDLSRLEVQRDSVTLAYEEGLTVQNALAAAGPPESPLQSLDVVPPFVVSAAEYSSRLAQGRQGENNFTGDQEPEAKSSSSGVGSRIGSPPVRAGLGGVAGLLLGICIVLIRARLDPRLRSRREVEDALGAPVLAEVAKQRRTASKKRPTLMSVEHPRSAVTEAYRMVRSSLLVGGVATADQGESPDGVVAEPAGRDEPRVVMVTSPGPSEGKTTTAANLAVVLAEAGYEVLVVNCDFRRPRLHAHFGLPHAPRQALETGIPGVTVVADVADATMRNPTEVVAAQRLLISRARKRYDVVVLDTAPLLATHDAASLLPSVDIVLLVAREGKTAREGAGEVRDLLRRRRAAVAGVVLTSSTGFGESRYYQKYRYGTYYAEDRTRRQKPPQSSTPSPSSSSPSSADRSRPHPTERVPTPVGGDGATLERAAANPADLDDLMAAARDRDRRPRRRHQAGEAQVLDR